MGPHGGTSSRRPARRNPLLTRHPLRCHTPSVCSGACGSCTPPTGTWAGRSTVPRCSPSRSRPWSAWSRWRGRPRCRPCWWPATCTTGPSRRPTRSTSWPTSWARCGPPAPRSSPSPATTTRPTGSARSTRCCGPGGSPCGAASTWLRPSSSPASDRGAGRRRPPRALPRAAHRPAGRPPHLHGRGGHRRRAVASALTGADGDGTLPFPGRRARARRRPAAGDDVRPTTRSSPGPWPRCGPTSRRGAPSARSSSPTPSWPGPCPPTASES